MINPVKQFKISLKISFQAYTLMMNRITRSLNIVTILTKQRSKNINFCQSNYIFSLNMQEAIFKVNTVKEVHKIYIEMIFTIW